MRQEVERVWSSNASKVPAHSTLPDLYSIKGMDHSTERTPHLMTACDHGMARNTATLPSHKVMWQTTMTL
jgi:hypothetical protein